MGVPTPLQQQTKRRKAFSNKALRQNKEGRDRLESLVCDPTDGLYLSHIETENLTSIFRAIQNETPGRAARVYSTLNLCTVTS